MQTLEKGINRMRKRISADRDSQISDEISEFYKDGGFDFHSYVRSNTFARRYAASRQKLRDRLVDDVNRTTETTVQKLFDSEEFGQLRITEDAEKKAEIIAEEFQELTTAVNRGTQEIGFFLLSDKDNGQGVIFDIYVPYAQVVTPTHCDIGGFSRANATMYARRSGVGLMSWGHSHGTLETFLSGEDRSTLKTEVPNFANVVQLKVDFGGSELPYRIRVSPTIVINARKNRFAAVQYRYNRLHHTPIGRPVQTSEQTLLNEGHDNRGVKIQIIRGNGRKINLDRSRIKQQLLCGYGDGGGVVINGSGRHERLADLHELARPVTGGPVHGELDLRVAELEAKYKGLQEDHSRLETDYKTVLREHARSNEERKKISSRLQELEHMQNLSYTERMANYYSPLMVSRAKKNRYLGALAKILSGEYRSSITSIREGSLQEDPNERRIWRWEDRLKAATALYNQNKVEFEDVDLRQVDQLRGILGENISLRGYYRKRIDRLINRFYR